MDTNQKLACIVGFLIDDADTHDDVLDQSLLPEHREFLKQNVDVLGERRKFGGPNHQFYFQLHRFIRRMIKTDEEIDEVCKQIGSMYERKIH